MIKTITRDEYRSLTRHQYAGTVAKLEADTREAFASNNPEWLGKHWAMWFEPGVGTTLGPVNITK